jgi:hypothetical protein
MQGLQNIAQLSNLTRNQIIFWSGQKLQPDLPVFNIAHLFFIPKEIDYAHFQRAFQTLINVSAGLRGALVAGFNM